MAKQKFSLTVSPTFTATVDIAVPGKGFSQLDITFKYREKEEFKAFLDSLVAEGEKPSDVDLILDMASGWDLDLPFDTEHIGQMLSRYMSSGTAILNTYIREQSGARQKN